MLLTAPHYIARLVSAQHYTSIPSWPRRRQFGKTAHIRPCHSRTAMLRGPEGSGAEGDGVKEGKREGSCAMPACRACIRGAKSRGGGFGRRAGLWQHTQGVSPLGTRQGTEPEVPPHAPSSTAQCSFLVARQRVGGFLLVPKLAQCSSIPLQLQWAGPCRSPCRGVPITAPNLNFRLVILSVAAAFWKRPLPAPEVTKTT